MRQLLLTMLATVCCMLFPLTQSANSQEQRPEEVKDEIVVIRKQERQPEVRVPQSFGSSQIRNWHAPDSKTLIIETSRGDFKATFANNCSGILFAESIGFESSGGNALDKFTRIVLPDGQTCFFDDLVVYEPDREPRQDNNEKSQ